MKIWTNNKFEGHWPVGTGAVVIAETREDAAKYLDEALPSCLGGVEEEDMIEMPFIESTVRILCDGNC